MSLLILNEDELRQSVTLAEAIEAVKSAFVASVEGRMHLPGAFTLQLPEVKGDVHVKGAYLNEALYYVIKVNSDFQDNPIHDLPVRTGFTAVFDAATGFPVALLVDNGYLSSLRAGAAGALAADYLANPHPQQIGILGSEDQAYMHLKALMRVRQFKTVTVWADSPDNADRYARVMVEDHDLDITIAPTVEAAVKNADLIITATYSQQPLIRGDWLKPGVHITAVGNSTRIKQELHLDVLKKSAVIIADQFEQCAATGELHNGLAAGVITPAHVQGELGDLIAGKIPGRTGPEQITLADLTGLDTHDTIVATLALEKALFLDLGQRVANSPTTIPYQF